MDTCGVSYNCVSGIREYTQFKNEFWMKNESAFSELINAVVLHMYVSTSYGGPLFFRTLNKEPGYEVDVSIWTEESDLLKYLNHKTNKQKEFSFS